MVLITYQLAGIFVAVHTRLSFSKPAGESPRGTL